MLSIAFLKPTKRELLLFLVIFLAIHVIEFYYLVGEVGAPKFLSYECKYSREVDEFVQQHPNIDFLPQCELKFTFVNLLLNLVIWYVVFMIGIRIITILQQRMAQYNHPRR